MTALRGDLDLRVAVGKAFLSQLDIRADYMPSRIKANSDIKKPNIPGYKDRNLNNREYAALLALSMIDGTFDKDRVTDPIHFNTDGTVKDGQHRWAAEDLLFR